MTTIDHHMMSSEVAFSFLALPTPPQLTGAMVTLKAFLWFFPPLRLHASTEFSCPAQYSLWCSLRQKFIRNVKLTHDISSFQVLTFVHCPSAFGTSPGSQCLCVFFFLQFIVVICRRIGLIGTTLIIRSGYLISNFHVLESSLEEF